MQHWKQPPTTANNNNSIIEIHQTMHIPSFFVGSTVTAGGFLLIHRELSHRERLSKKWLLREKFEEGVKEMWNDAKKSMPGNDDNGDAVSVQFFLHILFLIYEMIKKSFFLNLYLLSITLFIRRLHWENNYRTI